jgi:nucleotidyltransferase-like protein
VEQAIERLVEPFLKVCDRALGAGYSAVLHGSLVRGDYLPDWSDVNLLLILDDISPGRLQALQGAFGAWAKAHEQPPLFMSREEWGRAADVFPIEITDIRSGYRVLRGADPMTGLTVRRSDLRAALERDLRGRLVRLRQGFAALSDDPGALAVLARDAAPSLVVLLRGALALHGGPVPTTRPEAVRAAALAFGFVPDALLDAVGHLADGRWTCPPEAFAGCLEAVEATVRFVDHLSIGDDS